MTWAIMATALMMNIMIKIKIQTGITRHNINVACPNNKANKNWEEKRPKRASSRINSLIASSTLLYSTKIGYTFNCTWNTYQDRPYNEP